MGVYNVVVPAEPPQFTIDTVIADGDYVTCVGSMTMPDTGENVRRAVELLRNHPMMPAGLEVTIGGMIMRQPSRISFVMSKVVGLPLTRNAPASSIFTDVIGGRVTLTFQNTGAILPTVREGKLREEASAELRAIRARDLSALDKVLPERRSDRLEIVPDEALDLQSFPGLHAGLV